MILEFFAAGDKLNISAEEVENVINFQTILNEVMSFKEIENFVK